jgi:hypothetical protein
MNLACPAHCPQTEDRPRRARMTFRYCADGHSDWTRKSTIGGSACVYWLSCRFVCVPASFDGHAMLASVLRIFMQGILSLRMRARSRWAAAGCWPGTLALANPPGPGWTVGVSESSGGRQALPGLGPRGQGAIDQLLATVTALEFCEHGRGTSPSGSLHVPA